MQSAIVDTLDHLAAWRAELDRRTAALARFVGDHDLLDDSEAGLLPVLRDRLATDKVVLAFVAEFSRGKSELINAIFFANTGRRVLPATPGRTTMCPVELGYNAKLGARLSLLPITSRLEGRALAELRGRDEAWEHLPLNPDDPQALAEALTAVTRTRRVSLDDARALGFWNDEHPEDNPPLEADGQVDVPAWRHALINYPHPLLQRGLVVLDTPGLNAIGAEPELTLSLLPSAHATVFVLGADTGVTKSDLEIWREHLGGNPLSRFVVLNKIDALADPLATPAQVQAQIERQHQQTASTLGLPAERVFPLSARQALAARVDGDAAALASSRLPALEAALAAELLPRQHELLVQATETTVLQLRAAGTRRLSDRRRSHAEQLLELRGLRGKSGAKVRLMLQRVEAESAEFEGCTTRLAAVRAVQTRLLRNVLAKLSSDALRAEVAAMQSAIGAKPLGLGLGGPGARQAFATLCERLRNALDGAANLSDEMRQMLDASFLQLNTEYGFAFTLGTPPSLQPFAEELALLDQNYSRYLGLGQAWRMAVPGFAEQFRRMLLSKLRVVFENAAGELELWSKTASSQVDVQLRERRRSFKRRREALERIQAAAGELEARIAEVEAQDERLGGLQAKLDQLTEALLVLATPEAQAAAAAGSAPAVAAAPQRNAA
ncbi:MAG: dynamin family protein [Rubrivivax sp.]